MAQTVFPPISRSYIENFQYSFWYKQFSHVSPKSTVIRPLDDSFRSYLEANGVIIPEGSEDIPVYSTLSDHESSEDEGKQASNSRTERYSFPQLDEQIRDAIKRYGAVFPKLNWTSPKDAAWVLPSLKCTAPADVYLSLKSSDFVSHDLDASLAFEGCKENISSPTYYPTPHVLELVLKKWYPIDRGREFRCFVRSEILLAISQRDPNYYPSLNELGTKENILQSITRFWVQHIRGKFPGGSDYVFDIYLTRDLSSGHILDFNPYHQKTDSLLFTYDELYQLLESATVCMASATSESLVNPPAIFRIIDSHSHPNATGSVPSNQHNSVPFDALQVSTGNDIATFARLWEERLKQNLHAESDDESGGENN
ncbi:D123-domain-containing protein [Hysterangium stoloniferum]|nr:D123-domain-containing protein [Hysterangium stoloniferum]